VSDAIADARAALVRTQDTILNLKHKLSHTRLNQYAVRRNLLARIAAAEKRYALIYARLLRADPGIAVGSLYKPVKPAFLGGLNVRVEISLDGTYYSNPAPTVPANSIIWVRAIIDDSHRGETGIPKTHEMVHLAWVPGKGYTALDTVRKTGHNEYFVCHPLVITRRFRAPATNTKKNFMVYVDTFERVK